MKALNKAKLIEALRIQLEGDVTSLKAAARATYEAATHEESKPENEYDTRGLEASYLAGAQAKRVVELEELLALFKGLEARPFPSGSAIALTALVEVEHADKVSYVFMMPKGGGFAIRFEDQNVQIVTPSSPLGEALMGLKEGDSASVEVGDQVKEYEILSVQ